MTDKAISLANVGEEEEQDELGAAIKAKIDELKDAEVEKINEEKRKLEVMVKIFGRKTPLELSYMQVEKV